MIKWVNWKLPFWVLRILPTSRHGSTRGVRGGAHPPRRSYGRGWGAQPQNYVDVFRAFHVFHTPRKIQLDPCLIRMFSPEDSPKILFECRGLQSIIGFGDVEADSNLIASESYDVVQHRV